MPYITKDDYLQKIRENKLMQIIDNDETLLDEAENTAITIVKDRLFEKYDIKEIFNLEGEERHKQVVRYCINIALYIIYERVPDIMIPNRIINNYNDTMVYLDDVSKSIVVMDLPRKTINQTTVKSKIRITSRSPRSH